MASGFDAADQKIILQAVENVLEWWREEIATEGEAIAGERKARIDLLFFRYDAIAWEVLNYDHGDPVDAFLKFIADDVALKLEKAGTNEEEQKLCIEDITNLLARAKWLDSALKDLAIRTERQRGGKQFLILAKAALIKKLQCENRIFKRAAERERESKSQPM